MKKNKFLEKYHNKKTYIVVKFFVNFLFSVGFIWLLSSYYKAGGFKEWGIRMILITIFISIWFFQDEFLKAFLNEEYYSKSKSDTERSVINILFSIGLIILSRIFYKKLFLEIGKGHETRDLGPFFIALFIVIWISFDKIVDSLFLSSFQIDENMDCLPKFIEGEKTLVQYDLSKEITPSEAGFLLYRKADISNLLCIVYKRVNEKIIEIQMDNGKKYMRVIGKLGDNAPYYEKYLFQCFLSGRDGFVRLDKNKLRRLKVDINDLIFEKCRLKGYCNIKSNEFGKKIKSIAISLLCLVIFIYLIKDFMILMFFFRWVGFLFIIPYVITRFFYKKYSFKLTDKGKKVLSEIYGYKYYLEHCEEEQISANLGNDEVYSKVLPYAIAMKLNWKIIDELS